MADGALRVEIQRWNDPEYGTVFVILDEDGEFARATTITQALRYASDLLYGPGTGPRGFVWTAMEGIERAIADTPASTAFQENEEER